MSQNLPSTVLGIVFPWDLVEIEKKGEDIENCVRAIYSLYPDTPDSLYPTFQQLLNGTYDSWGVDRNSHNLQKVQYLPCNCTKSVRNRLKINSATYSIVYSMPDTAIRHIMVKDLNLEMECLLMLSKFFAYQDSSKVQ